jgi:hypothetical protein
MMNQEALLQPWLELTTDQKLSLLLLETLPSNYFPRAHANDILGPLLSAWLRVLLTPPPE